MAGGRNYTVTMRTGADGTQYVRISEAPLPHSQPARHWAAALAERLTMLRNGFQKAFRLASRRA